MRVTASALVDRPVPEVWDVLADHEGMSSWLKGLRVRLDQVGDIERNGVGAVRRIDQPGPIPAIVEEVTAFDPGSVLGYRAVSGVPFRGYSGEVRLTAEGDGTRIDWTLEAAQRIPGERVVLGVVARVLLRLLTAAAVRPS